ncbi:MAG: ATP-binding protein [Bacteroidia bacterium]
MKFADIIGQRALKAKLIQTVKEGRVSHAQLFLGPEGSGKLPLAIAYAQYLNCKSPTEDDSCGICSSCQKYNKLIHPDLHFSFPIVNKGTDAEKNICAAHMKDFREAFLADPYMSYHDWMQQHGAENKQGNISKFECYDIISKLGLAPFEAGFKVLIMWLPEYLKDAGNVLLKIIEEPPQNTLFILVAERQEMLLSTISSRTQLVKIPRLEIEDLTAYLSVQYELDEATARNVALLADGNARSARELMGHELGINEQLFMDFMRHAFTGKGPEILKWIEKANELGREGQKNLLQYGLHIIRECFLMRFGSAKLARLKGSEQDFVTKFSVFITQQNVAELSKQLNDAIYFIERNANSRLVFHNLANEAERLLAMARKQNQLTA